MKVKLIIIAVLCFAFAVHADTETPQSWRADGERALEQVLARKPNTQLTRNVILFVGDGMGISTITAARILAGQKQGGTGEEHRLSFEKLAYTALAKTYNTNQQTPDSAGTMTAMMTGVKTKAGFISVNQNATRRNCTSQTGNELQTFLEELEDRNYATGIISTARITHATPAATYAHSVEREWEGDNDMPLSAIKQGCRDIASQLLSFSHGDGVDVVMGGGRRYFLPDDVADPEYPKKKGYRKDGRDLTREWERQYRRDKFVWNKEQFDNIDLEKVSRLFALFEPSHMQFEADRQNDGAGEPSLAEMTSKAIDILKQNEKGYFLMVEGGRIDHAHHYGNAHRALHDTVAFDEAVAIAIEKIDFENTLLIVTADHSHVFTMGGYPVRGNPILGKVIENNNAGESKGTEALAIDGKPYTTLGYYNGDGHAVMDDIGKREKATGAGEPGRADISKIDTESSNYYQESLIPLIDETHGGEDVAIFADGPWAHLFRGVQEQNYIYYVMRHALKLRK
ncbi:MAG: alkaline phosphatase [Gammaproteobacteria bacterium]|nr:alkaline phosphatase [Gammaproteobacteria bacterium]